MNKITMLVKKYKSLIMYAIFGVLTTLINVICYQLLYKHLEFSNVGSTVFAWVVAVIFAYITNRRFVFQSKSVGTKAILKEFIKFFVCRLATGFLDVGIMYITVDILHLNALLMKIASNVLVIIINYIASKFIIFNK